MAASVQFGLVTFQARECRARAAFRAGVCPAAGLSPPEDFPACPEWWAWASSDQGRA